MLTNAALNESAKCRYHEVKMKGLIDSSRDFNHASCKKSNLVKFWYVFLQDMVSVLIDLNQSHREGSWNIHLSAVCRFIPLFFFSLIAGYHCILKTVWLWKEDFLICGRTSAMTALLFNKHRIKEVVAQWSKHWTSSTTSK